MPLLIETWYKKASAGEIRFEQLTKQLNDTLKQFFNSILQRCFRYLRIFTILIEVLSTNA